MIRSLRLKLIFALLLTSLTGVALVGIVARYLTATEFDRFLRERAQADFITLAQDYYQQHGSWEGLDRSLQVIFLEGMPPAGATPLPPLFVLADAQDIVVTPGGPYQMGERIPADVVRLGTALELDGQRIGTVIALDMAPERDHRARDFLARTGRTLLYATIGVALIALLMGVLLARRLMRPITALTTAIRAMQRGELRQEVAVQSRDELGELVAAFNQMSADLAQAQQARRQMTADIAHELRTPLTVLTGYLEGLRDGVLQPRRERFQIMYDEARQLQRLVDDLRLLSLADAGELPLRRQEIAPNELLEAVAAAFAQQAVDRQITLQVCVAADLLPLPIDRERMIQVLGNLVSNALRYTPAQGNIRLAADQTAESIRFEVVDTGVGIDPEALPYIFERFYRAEASRHQQEGESGLGLAIAKAIVVAHGGSISATSVPGRGTHITIALPLAANGQGLA